jgi:hypothetical protein
MREVLVRLGCLLFLWLGFIDLFIGPVKQLWIWTLGVIAAFFLIEGAGQLIISVYLKHTSKEG